jgi:hypothetical protein
MTRLVYTPDNETFTQETTMTPTQNNRNRLPKNVEGVHGEGIVVNRTRRGFQVREVDHGALRDVGTFRRSVDAWRAVDAFDTETL